MNAKLTNVLLSFLAVSSLPVVLGSRGFSLPLVRKSVQGASLPPLSSNGIARRSVDANLVDDEGFWFANFTIGKSKNLEILIDTGSSDAILNPGVYQPSASSKNLNKPFTISYSTTNPDGSGSETCSGPQYQDIIALDGTNLSIAAQTLGSITSPKTPPTFPNSGLIGFAGIESSALGATPWFQSVCNAKKVSSCRFGLALETDNTGTAVLGSVDNSLFTGALSTTPISGEWSVTGNVVANGKVVESNAQVATDSGTTVIFGPTASVQALFKAAGIKAVNNNGNIDGTYPCNNPPKLGFSFPSASGATSPVFTVLPEVLAETTGSDGTCTAVIHGTNDYGDTWLVGQAFFQGKYVDHNIDAGTMGFANLITA